MTRKARWLDAPLRANRCGMAFRCGNASMVGYAPALADGAPRAKLAVAQGWDDAARTGGAPRMMHGQCV